MNKPKLLWLIACIAASAGSAMAQADPLAPPVRGVVPTGAGSTARRPVHPAVVRIVAPGRGSISYGSGSLVAVNERHGLVVTNWHVINEATGQVTVEFPDGFESAATVQKIDRDWDLAALVIWKPPVEPVTLAHQAPQPGEMLTIAGYGPGKYRAASGRCTQYVAPGMRFPYEMVELAAAARQGDSGGPIFNSRGELAGVLFGEGEGRTSGSYCGRVQWFLDSVIGEAARRGPIAAPGVQANVQSLAQSNTGTSAAAGLDRPLVAKTMPHAVVRENQLSRPAPWRPVADSLSQATSRPDQTSDAARQRLAEQLPLASPGETVGASAARSAPVAATEDSARTAPAESHPADGDRWGQIKDFLGVIAAIGFVLFIVRSLASAGPTANGKTATDRAT